MKKNKKAGKLLIILSVLAVLAGAAFFTYRYILEKYTVKNVIVEGNVHHTDDEIKSIVMEGKYGNNSLYLSYKYKDREITDVPFVETIKVEIESPDTIHILVYEKILAGFIEYLGRYIYFDREGIVVESSTIKSVGIPEVVGVDFDYVVLHEKLPAQDESLFAKVLDITKLMTKYSVNAQKMYFKENGDIVLYKDDIIIRLGKDENLDDKIMNLPGILEKLEGMKGVLRMENYNNDTKRISFDPE